eukprot:453899-Prymnesium_polylepis.2
MDTDGGASRRLLAGAHKRNVALTQAQRPRRARVHVVCPHALLTRNTRALKNCAVPLPGLCVAIQCAADSFRPPRTVLQTLSGE